METMEAEAAVASNSIPEQRLVHLDLKGAPPKICYYEKLFPLLSKWGATGLLVEYEDMFPYSGMLQELACPNAYSVEEIHMMHKLAAANNLIIVPLVQTFGHMEFVLKHEKFHCLREVDPYPMTLCPLASESLPLVTNMIDQVMELHPQIKWFHIGADEVFHIGVCEKCRQHMALYNMSPAQLFFSHVKNVLSYLREKYPEVGCIMWDDMYRDVELDIIRASGIADLVEPMVWVYGKEINLPSGMWERYSQVFPNVWAASAFKGATGPCMFITDVGFHVANHQEWLEVVKTEIKPKFKGFRGYCTTGWQRYDHFSVLCELLPVGLPSLALCLQTFTDGAFTEGVHHRASGDLNFKEIIPLCPFVTIGSIPQCNFPGSGVFIGAHVLLAMEGEYKAFLENDRMKGWMTPYHVKHNFTNPAHIDNFLPHAQQLLENYLKLETDFKVLLREVFYGETVDEWISCFIKTKIEKISSAVETAQQQLAIKGRPKVYPNGFPK